MRIRSGLLLGLFAACSNGAEKDATSGGGVTDRTGVGDADTDADSDGDSDADTDADTDTEPSTGYPPDCNADYLSATPTPGSAGSGCLTQEVFCGDVIYATNEGGDTLYDYGYWEDHFLISTLDAGDLDAPERVYLFRGLTFEQTVTFTIDSCGDMWGATIVYGDVSGEFCDYDDPLIQGQHMIGGGTTLNVGSRVNGSYSGEYDVVAIVDGYQGNVGNFTMTVGCGYE